jgi:hypothetical protein
MKTLAATANAILRVLLITVLLFGCASESGSRKGSNSGSVFGYTLGSPPRYDSIKKIHIPRVHSRIQSEEPHLQMEATNIIIDHFTRELTYDVVPTVDEADGILDIELVDLTLTAVRYADKGTSWNKKSIPSEYRAQVLASVRMLETGTSNLVWEAKRIRGKFDYNMSEDYQLIRREAILQATGDLAREIVETAVERW